MQIHSKLTAAALVAGVAAQGPSVYISPGSASFVPGTFGTTSSDGSYISAGVANNGNFDDVSFTSQNGGFPANVGYNNYGAGFAGAGFPGAGYPGAGFQGGFQGGYQGGFAPQQQGFTPPPPPIYQAGTGVSGGNIPSGGFTPPPPPIYQAGTGVSGGNLPSGGPGPAVEIGQVVHTGGFRKTQKRSVQQYPYGYSGYNAYNPYAGPTVTIGQPPAYFVPGTFGTTFSDGGYTSWGTPSTSYKLNKRQTISATAGIFGPTVTVGAPPAYFVPGTFGTTFSDGGYTSWGVAQPQVPQVPAYGAYPYHKRE